jgi:hypothetical protein
MLIRDPKQLINTITNGLYQHETEKGFINLDALHTVIITIFSYCEQPMTHRYTFTPSIRVQAVSETISFKKLNI